MARFGRTYPIKAHRSPPPGIYPAPVSIYPGLTSTLLQPGNKGNLSWTQTRMNSEFYGSGTGMYQAGITTAILQWSADPYQNTAYYPSPTIPNNAGQLAPQMLTAAAQSSPAMNVWMGLGQYDGTNGNDYYNFYYNCVNPGTGWVMGTLLPFQKKVAAELYTLYGSSIAGWYIPQEIDGNYPAGSTQAATAASYYQALTSWLHTNYPGVPVMVSPFYADLNLTASQFASTLTQLFVSGGGNTCPDVIALQSGAGDASIGDSNMTPAQITSYFSATSTALSGTGIALWENCDMYDGSGGPMPTANLAASMTAAAPYVTSYTGFSFTSQMSPLGLGTASVYNAYLAALNQVTRIPFADSGSGSESASAAVAVPVADSGTGSDIVAPAAAAPLADAGSGSETASVAATLSLADNGTGADSLTGGSPVSLADSGTGSDSVSVGAVGANLTDAGSGADAVTVAVAASLADAGSAAESLTPAAAFTVTDAGSGADALTSAIGVTSADAGTGSETIAAAVATPLTDTGAASEAAMASTVLAVADSGAGTDAASVATTAGLADAGAGSDALTAAPAISLTDAGTGNDSSLIVADGIFPADSGTGSESFTTLPIVPLADSGTGTEALSTAVTFGLADAGTGGETFGIPVPITLTDPDGAFGVDTLTAGPGLADTGTGSDAITTGPGYAETGTGDDSAFAVIAATTLADVGAGDDRPWEYASIGTPVYPYYVSLPDEALERVQVGDEFLWFAAG